MKHSKRRREFPATAPPPVDLPPTALMISSTPLITSAYRPGVALVQKCLGPTITSIGGLTAALTRLGECAMIANVHSQGFNESTITPNELWLTIANPPSATDPYKQGVWSYLDTRLEQLKNQAVTAYISLLCPYWMQIAGTAGDGVHGYLEIDNAHPETEHIAAMAQLVDIIVRRYKVGGTGNPGGTVNRITGGLQMWNEWKGLWNVTGGDKVRMTDNYNACWDAAKAADPTIKVGGPYMNFQVGANSSAEGTNTYLRFHGGNNDGLNVEKGRLQSILYWWANKNGADFYMAGAANQSPIDVITWVRTWLSPTIPIIQAEMYPGEKGDGTRSDANVRFLTARLAENMRQQCVSGWSGGQIWGPEELSSGPTAGALANFFWRQNSTATIGRAGEIAQLFKNHFALGTVLYNVTTNDPLVTGVANATHVLVISNRTNDIDVNVDGTAVAIPHQSYTLVTR